MSLKLANKKSIIKIQAEFAITRQLTKMKNYETKIKVLLAVHNDEINNQLENKGRSVIRAQRV